MNLIKAQAKNSAKCDAGYRRIYVERGENPCLTNLSRPAKDAELRSILYVGSHVLEISKTELEMLQRRIADVLK
jgi:hypothetical protein